jgi:hypothetical protein
MKSSMTFCASPHRCRRRAKSSFHLYPPNDDLDGVDLEIVRWTATKFAKIGEPWKSRVRPRAMVKRLMGLGFREVFHLSPELAHARYFVGRSDKLTAPHFEQMIAATV